MKEIVKILEDGTTSMLRFGIEFYDNKHRERLKANCERYEQMEKLVVSGFEVEAEELFSYSMFVEQLLTENGWQSYRDLQTALPPFRQTWERHFNCSALTVYAKRETSLIPKHHKEALGVGGALSVVSNVYSLTEADWETIPEQHVKSLDFKIASTGTYYIEVEAKGAVVPKFQKSYLSDHKRSIERKKQVQRELGNRNTMIGVIVAIPSDSSLKAKCFILDPPPVRIPFDPYKYKLLSRLYFYWRELRLVSRAHFLEVLINRIKIIQMTDDYKSLDGLPLFNSRGEPHQVPNSLFETRSSVYRRSAFGEVLPLGDGRFFFYGFDTDVVETLIKQDFSRLNALSFKSRTESDTRVSAKIPRRLLGGPKTEVKYDEDREEDENRKTLSMVGDLVHTSSGRVLGCVKPVSR